MQALAACEALKLTKGLLGAAGARPRAALAQAVPALAVLLAHLAHARPLIVLPHIIGFVDADL